MDSRILCKLGILTLLGAVAAAFASPASATVTITFDELKPQLLDGVNFMGVTFDFKIDGEDSDDAAYNAGGLQAATSVKGAVLEGNAEGLLTLDLDETDDVIPCDSYEACFSSSQRNSKAHIRVWCAKCCKWGCYLWLWIDR